MNNPVHMGWKFLRKGDGSSELSPFFAKKEKKLADYVENLRVMQKIL